MITVALFVAGLIAGLVIARVVLIWTFSSFLRGILLPLLILGMSVDAEACTRCGLFGQRCRFVSHHAKVVQPVAAYPQAAASTITIQNNYNGAALTSPLALQGNTVYGYHAAASAYSVNPEQVLNQAARLVENAQGLAQTGFQQFSAAATAQLAGQQEVAKIIAATEHLKAANVAASTSQSITVKTDASGHATVTTDPPAGQPATEAPKAFATCTKCHSGATPKGQFSLDGESFSAPTITKALRAIASGQMPPADAGVELSQQDKGEIMQYLLGHEAE